MIARESAASGSPLLRRRLPPVAEFTVASLALMLGAGIYLASSLPRRPSLTPVVVLVAGGIALTVIAMVLLARIRPFAWGAFFLVGKWALAGYAVISGLLAYVFVYDRTSGSSLAVLLVSLAVFAVDVPMVIAFTVARYQDPAGLGAGAVASAR